MNNELLKIRKVIKAKKPNFMRQEFDRGTKLEHKWVKPRGRTNKMRSCLRGQKAMPSVGYSSPREVRGLMPGGEKSVYISNVNDLGKITKDEAAIVRSNVGARKKIQIIEGARVKGIKLYNVRDADKFAERIKKEKDERKKQNIERKTKKEETEKKAEEKRKEDEKKTEEKK